MRSRRHTPSAQSPPGREPVRAAFTLIEMTLALTLAAAFCGIFAPILYRIAQQRQAVIQEQFALIQLSNVLDDLTTCAPAQLPARIEHWTNNRLPEWQQRLPTAELTLTPADSSDEQGGRAIECRLRWTDRAGRWLEPLVVTGWNYHNGEARP